MMGRSPKVHDDDASKKVASSSGGLRQAPANGAPLAIEPTSAGAAKKKAQTSAACEKANSKMVTPPSVVSQAPASFLKGDEEVAFAVGDGAHNTNKSAALPKVRAIQVKNVVLGWMLTDDPFS